MIDKNTRNCNLTKKITDFIFVLGGLFLGTFISEKFFNDSFWFSLIFIIIFMVIMTPIKISIDRKIDKYYLNKE